MSSITRVRVESGLTMIFLYFPMREKPVRKLKSSPTSSVIAGSQVNRPKSS
jgi:hypothetical protein